MPVKARIVNQDHSIRWMLVEHTFDLRQEPKKARELGDDGKKTHDGQFAHVVEQLAAGGAHLGPAETCRDQRRSAAQLTNQICAVEVAARFADREENLHATIASLPVDRSV